MVQSEEKDNENESAIFVMAPKASIFIQTKHVLQLKLRISGGYHPTVSL